MTRTRHRRAIIFDFNGVIADDEPMHFQAFQQVLSEYGLRLTKDDYYGRYRGMDERNCTASLILDTRGIEDRPLVENITRRKTDVFAHMTGTHRPSLFPGAIELVKRATASYRLAIASGGRREQIQFALAGTAIASDFDAVVAAEDVAIGKPDPSIYRTALARLNQTDGPSLHPDDCIVIEDSIAGIQSAHGAGMRVIAVATTYAAEDLREADRIVSTIADLSVNAIDAVFTK